MEHIDDFDGIGIALAGGLSAIDIDHCIEDGKLSEMAEDIITLADSYTEVSPSGKGIRIIGKTRKTDFIDYQRCFLQVQNIVK